MRSNAAEKKGSALISKGIVTLCKGNALFSLVLEKIRKEGQRLGLAWSCNGIAWQRQAEVLLSPAMLWNSMVGIAVLWKCAAHRRKAAA